MFGQGNPYVKLAKACKRLSPTSGPYLRQVLSPVLYHRNKVIIHKALDSLLESSDGKLTAQSRLDMIEYQRQHLEKRLACFGVLLFQSTHSSFTDDGKFVTYKAELNGKAGVQRVLCRTHIPATLSDFDVCRKSETANALAQVIGVVHDLADHDKGNFVQLLLFDKTGRQKFYVSDQDWTLPTLSQVLLDDLNQSEQKILLEQKMEIIRAVTDATMFAHRKEILLRSLCAESFRVKMCHGKMKVIFWDIDAARHGMVDSGSSPGPYFMGRCITLLINTLMY